jgi:WD40 repeat protein
MRDLGTASADRVPLDNAPKSGIERLVFSPDGRWVAAADSGHEVGVWDTTSRRRVGGPLTPLPGRSVLCLAFSPGGERLAVGYDNGRFVVWGLISRQATASTLGQHEEPISSLSFSPDGQLLVAGDGEGRISLWDTARFQLVGELVGAHDASVNGVAFDPESRLLASGGEDGVVALWDLDPRSWRSRACGIANRNLTCGEWRESLGDRAYREVCPDLPPPPDRERCATAR